MTLERIAELRLLATMDTSFSPRGEPPVCARCGEEYLLDDLKDQTPHCHPCAHEAVREWTDAAGECFDEIERLRLDYAILSDDYRAIQGNAAEAYQRGMKAGIEVARAVVKDTLTVQECGVTGFRQGDRPCGYPRGHEGMHQWDS
jgi:hypothetical protein